MTIRESLQTIAALKEQETIATKEKEQALQEFEELKKDIYFLIEEEVTEWLDSGITNIKDAFIYYYTYEPELLEGIYSGVLNRFTVKKEDKSFVDSDGQTRYTTKKASKYSGYNQDALRDLIAKLFVEYLTIAKAHEAEYIKLIKEKEQEKKQKEKKQEERGFYFFIDCFKTIYKKQGVTINQFISNLNTPEFRKIFFEELGLDELDYDTLKTYNKAVKEFTKEYAEPNDTDPGENKKTIAGLSVGAFTLAGVIGLFEAFGRKR